MRFVIFVIDNSSHSATGNEITAIDEFNAKLKKNENFIYAAGISAPSSAKVIDNRKDSDLVSPGSLFDSSDYYSGFWLIDADNEETALDLAKAGSKACNRRVELRPFL